MKENKIDPPRKTAAPLQTIEFLCYTENTVVWLFQGGPLPLNAEEVRRSETRWSILKINNVMLNNAGTYTCVGEESKYVIFEADAVLSVRGKQILFNSFADILGIYKLIMNIIIIISWHTRL